MCGCCSTRGEVGGASVSIACIEQMLTRYTMNRSVSVGWIAPSFCQNKSAPTYVYEVFAIFCSVWLLYLIWVETVCEITDWLYQYLVDMFSNKHIFYNRFYKPFIDIYKYDIHFYKDTNICSNYKEY